MQSPKNPLPQQDQKDQKDVFKVLVRCRPLNPREESQIQKENQKKRIKTVKMQDDMVFLLEPDENPSRKQEKCFIFDKAFDEQNTTEQIFVQSIKDSVCSLLDGFNLTIFAYGMTGAGKSFTMFGDFYDQVVEIQHPGLVVYAAQELFRLQRECLKCSESIQIKLSYIEIYNEQIRDLLVSGSEQLMLVEDQEKGIVVPGLSDYEIFDLDDLIRLLVQGNQRRVKASTSFNQVSSRSHALILFNIEKSFQNKGGGVLTQNIVYSRLSLVDLAGSERACVSDNKGERMREGANINKSLLALGNCINILSDPNKKGQFVPYRDSKLTRLLKDSLGGNTLTLMVACISPVFTAYEETANTLKYASRARNIKKKVRVNQREVEMHVYEYKNIIENLQKEIGALQAQINLQDENNQFQKKNFVQENNRLQESKVLEQNIDEISQKIFKNLEEFWEISTTLQEIDQLNEQNVQDLSNGNTNVARQNELRETIEINEKIKNEMMDNLQKNQTEKKQLYQELKKIGKNTQHYHLNNNNKTENQSNEKIPNYLNYEIDAEFKYLKLEKINLCTENLELKKQNFHLQKEKEKTDSEIEKMKLIIENLNKKICSQQNMISEQGNIIQNLARENQNKKAINHSQSSQSPIDYRKSRSVLSNYSDHYNNNTSSHQIIPNNNYMSNSQIKKNSQKVIVQRSKTPQSIHNNNYHNEKNILNGVGVPQSSKNSNSLNNTNSSANNFYFKIPDKFNQKANLNTLNHFIINQNGNESLQTINSSEELDLNETLEKQQINFEQLNKEVSQLKNEAKNLELLCNQTKNVQTSKIDKNFNNNQKQYGTIHQRKTSRGGNNNNQQNNNPVITSNINLSRYQKNPKKNQQNLNQNQVNQKQNQIQTTNLNPKQQNNLIQQQQQQQIQNNLGPINQEETISHQTLQNQFKSMKQLYANELQQLDLRSLGSARDKMRQQKKQLQQSQNNSNNQNQFQHQVQQQINQWFPQNNQGVTESVYFNSQQQQQLQNQQQSFQNISIQQNNTQQSVCNPASLSDEKFIQQVDQLIFQLNKDGINSGDQEKIKQIQQFQQNLTTEDYSNKKIQSSRIASIEGDISDFEVIEENDFCNDINQQWLINQQNPNLQQTAFNSSQNSQIYPKNQKINMQKGIMSNILQGKNYASIVSTAIVKNNSTNRIPSILQNKKSQNNNENSQPNIQPNKINRSKTQYENKISYTNPSTPQIDDMRNNLNSVFNEYLICQEKLENRKNQNTIQ